MADSSIVVPRVENGHQLRKFRSTHKESFPDDVQVSLCRPNEAVGVPCSNHNSLKFHPIYVVLGLKFPLPAFIRRFLHHYQLALTQLCPCGYRILLSFLALDKLYGINIGFSEFRKIYNVKHKSNGVYCIAPRNIDAVLITDLPRSDKNWDLDVLEVSGNWEFGNEDNYWAVPRKWGTLPERSNDIPEEGTFSGESIASAFEIRDRSCHTLLNLRTSIFVTGSVFAGNPKIGSSSDGSAKFRPETLVKNSFNLRKTEECETSRGKNIQDTHIKKSKLASKRPVRRVFSRWDSPYSRNDGKILDWFPSSVQASPPVPVSASISPVITKAMPVSVSGIEGNLGADSSSWVPLSCKPFPNPISFLNNRNAAMSMVESSIPPVDRGLLSPMDDEFICTGFARDIQAALNDFLILRDRYFHVVKDNQDALRKLEGLKVFITAMEKELRSTKEALYIAEKDLNMQKARREEAERKYSGAVEVDPKFIAVDMMNEYLSVEIKRLQDQVVLQTEGCNKLIAPETSQAITEMGVNILGSFENEELSLSDLVKESEGFGQDCFSQPIAPSNQDCIPELGPMCNINTVDPATPLYPYYINHEAWSHNNLSIENGWVDCSFIRL